MGEGALSNKNCTSSISLKKRESGNKLYSVGGASWRWKGVRFSHDPLVGQSGDCLATATEGSSPSRSTMKKQIHLFKSGDSIVVRGEEYQVVRIQFINSDQSFYVTVDEPALKDGKPISYEMDNLYGQPIIYNVYRTFVFPSRHLAEVEL